jgi:hypothetical protein
MAQKGFRLILRALPITMLEDHKEFCNDDSSINLNNELVISPILNPKHTQIWDCLNCNGNDFNEMISYDGSLSIPAHFLDVSSAIYALVNSDTDTIYLKYSVTDSNSCTSIDSTHIIIHANGIAPTINKGGTTLFSNVSNVEWFRDGVYLAGRDGDSISADTLGVYKARYLGINGCYSNFSNEISKTLTIDPISKASFKIYPNPTSNRLVVSMENGSIDLTSIILFDAQGRIVNTTIDLVSNSIQLTWEGASGIYLLQFKDNSGTVTNSRIVNLN